MSAFRVFSCAVAAATLLMGSGVGLTASPAAECALPVGVWMGVPSNVRSADPQIRAQLLELAAGSQIVRDMLDEIANADQALVILRLNPRLPIEEHRHGLSTAGLSNGALVAQVEVGTNGSVDYRRAVLAHELAHLVELVALPRLPARTLASILMSREGHHAPWSSSMRLETSFAQAVERMVGEELQTGLPPATGQFQRVAIRHGVELASAQPPMPCATTMTVSR